MEPNSLSRHELFALLSLFFLGGASTIGGANEGGKLTWLAMIFGMVFGMILIAIYLKIVSPISSHDLKKLIKTDKKILLSAKENSVSAGNLKAKSNLSRHNYGNNNIQSHENSHVFEHKTTVFEAFSSCFSPKIAVVFAIFSAVFAMYSCITTLAIFLNYTEAASISTAPMLAVAVFLAITLYFILRGNIAGIGRLGAIIFPLAIIFTLASIAATIPALSLAPQELAEFFGIEELCNILHFKPENQAIIGSSQAFSASNQAILAATQPLSASIQPLSASIQPVSGANHGISALLSGIYHATVFPFAEAFFAILLLAPHVSKPRKKTCFSAALLGGCSIILIFAKNLSALGYSSLQQHDFASFTVAGMVSLGSFFQRFEILVAANFLLCCVFKAAIFLIFVRELLYTLPIFSENGGENARKRAVLCLFLASIPAFCAAFLMPNLSYLNAHLEIYKYIMMPVAIIMPLLMLVFRRFKR